MCRFVHGPGRTNAARRCRTALRGAPRGAGGDERQPMTVMFDACGPFWPCVVSYSTLAFSSSER